MTNLTEKDFAEEGYFYQMGVPPVRADILMGIPGVDFADAWPRRIIIEFDNLPVSFIAKEDLIVKKRASGHQQDLRDAHSLTQSPD